MQWKRKASLATVALFLFSVLFTACSPNISAPAEDTSKDSEQSEKGQTITLTMWDSFTDPIAGKIFDEIIKNFQNENPNVKIKRNIMRNDDLRNTIKPALTSGKGPDLFIYDSGPGYLGVLAKAGLALDLTPYAGIYGWQNKFPDWINERVTFDGKMYGIGNEVELLGVYYNKKIFKELGVEVPKTYDEFLEIAKKAKDKNIVPVSFDDKDQWPAFHLESVFYTIVAGKEKLESAVTGKESFDQPVFAEALDTFAKLIKDGYTTQNPLSVSYDDGNKEFFSGKAAMRITGTWMVAGMVENMKDNVGFFLLPPAKPELSLTGPGGIGSAMVISSKTKYPNESAKFLDFMFNEASSKIWYENSKIPPVNIDVNTLNVNSLFKDVVQMANSPAGLSHNVDVVMPQKVNDVTKNMLQELIAGKKTGAEVVKEKQKAFEEERAAGNF